MLLFQELSGSVPEISTMIVAEWMAYLTTVVKITTPDLVDIQPDLESLLQNLTGNAAQAAQRLGAKLGSKVNFAPEVLIESQLFLSERLLGLAKENERPYVRPFVMAAMGEMALGFAAAREAQPQSQPVSRITTIELQGMFAAAPTPILFVDEHGSIALVNPQAAVLFGYSAAELVGHPIEIVIPLDAHDVHQSHRAGYMAQPATRLMGENLSLHGQRRDGTHLPVDVGLSVVVTEHGRWVMCIIKDLSAQEQATKSLQDSHQFLQSVLNTLAAHVVIVNEDGIIVEVNEAWRQYADANGLQWADYGIGRNYLRTLEMVEGDGDEAARDILGGVRRVLQGEIPYYEYTYPCHPPHGLSWYTVQVTRFESEQGLHLVFGHYDVTERVLLERNLNQTSLLLESAIHTSPTGIILVDENRNVLHANSAALGLPHTAVPDPSAWIRSWTFRHPDGSLYKPDELPLNYAVATGQIVQEQEVLVERPDQDNPHWLLVTAAPIRNEVNRVVAAIAVLHDITERKQAERALQDSEARFRHVFEHAAVGILWVNLQSHIMRVNPAFCAMLGYAHEADLIGKHIDDVTHADDIALGQRARQRALAGHISEYTLEKRYLRPDGTAVWGNVSTSLLSDETGAPQYFIAVVVDVTERRNIEASLRHTQKLESLGLLAGGIAHDFNNLLSAILAESTLASLKLADTHTARLHINKTLQVVERAANLTRQLLAYAGKETFERKPLDLNSIIEDNLSLLEATMPNGIALRHQLTPLPLIVADAGQMQQVVMNLVINAAEAYDMMEGIVLVETSVVEIHDGDPLPQGINRPLPAGQYVCFCVTDHGQGMSAATIERIFEPFFTTKVTGRGLGLSAVQNILADLGGAMGIQSMEGVGTTFELFFPAYLPEPDFEALPSLNDLNNQGCILLVDDEDVIRRALAEVLDLAGFAVITAVSGEDAVAKFKAHQAEIAAVVIDINMPGMAGDEAVGHLLKIVPDLPVILMSGYGSLSLGRELLDLPTVRVLKKPFGFNELVNAIDMVRSLV